MKYKRIEYYTEMHPRTSKRKWIGTVTVLNMYHELIKLTALTKTGRI